MTSTIELEKSRQILKQYWGFDSFRPLQEEIIDNIIAGQDSLSILPTGGGKSICFQIPGLVLGGLTIVVSPLIALMEDQVSSLRANGINAALITSAMTYREIDITLDNARFGKMNFLYTSPERITSPLFQERCKSMNVSLIVVDEAHCISEWGHDFRPAYRNITELRLIHPEVPVAALTASATTKTQKDIVEQLNLDNPCILKAELERPNISYNVVYTENKLKSILDFCLDYNSHTGIIYCRTRRSVKDVAKQLLAQNLSTGTYHGGMDQKERKKMLSKWMKGDIKIMVATNAFGMGIDKSDVRYVLHFGVPNNIEAYYQEAGRAGRDGHEAQAIAYWESKDVEEMQAALNKKYPSIKLIKHVYESICNHLSIAVGSGDQETHNIDLHALKSSFGIESAEVYYSLKLLQLNNTLVFYESKFHPTKLKFAIGNRSLYSFQVKHEILSKLITLLTRSYPGIFERFIRIDEIELSKRLSLSLSELTEELKSLEKFGVIDIAFSSNSPKITLSQDRIPNGQLTLSHEIYADRKKNDALKLNSIRAYLTGTSCRAQNICAYFGSEQMKCGKCDVCVLEISSEHNFKELIALAINLLPSTVNKISNELSIHQDITQKILQNLLLEEKIIFEDGQFLVV